MKRLIPIALLAATAYGHSPFDCSVMKSTPFYGGSERVYTGRIEDRVNLWPIAYYREPALSVLWPIFSLTDDHLAIRPIYSQYRQDGKDSDYDEFNFLWPICQFDTKHDEHRIFPLFWGDGNFDLFPLLWWRFDKSFTLFPLVWWKKNDYFHVLPLWWSDSGQKLLLPFYYQDENSLTVIPFYGKTRRNDGFTEWYGPYGRHRDEQSPERNYDWCFPFYYRDATSFVTPLFGWDRSDRSSWALPLYYRDHEGFFSLPWASGGDEGSRWWCVPPLLSWGTREGDEWSQRYLLGMFGFERKGGNTASWLFPLYYSDMDVFMTPLFGRNEKANWCVPLWYRDDRRLLTLPYCTWWKENGDWDGSFVLPALTYFGADGDFASLLWGKTGDTNWFAPLWWQDERNFVSLLWCRDGSGNTDTCVVPPLLSWMKRTECGDKMLRFLLGLGGVNVERNGDVDSSWVFPLYYHDDRRFLSLPFGHERDGFTYLTPFVGVTHGEHRKGGWLWPLFGWTGDDRMDEAEAMINASTLDPKVKLEKRESEWGGRKHQWHEVEGVKVHVYDSSWRLSGLSTSDRSISWSAAGDGRTVTGEETSGFGNVFAYKSEHRRAVTFDAKTREKIRVDESGESGLFCKLLWHSEYEHEKGRHYDKKSILWRAWHYENDNGNVSVDAVPFFTYDSKTNGYSKTSLCWRLFRNEYDPKTDRRSVDFLFVPIWR